MKKLAISLVIIMAIAVAGFGVAFVCTGFDFDLLPNVLYASTDNDFTESRQTVAAENAAEITTIEVDASTERILVSRHDGEGFEVVYFQSEYLTVDYSNEGGKIKLKSSYEWKKQLFKMHIQTKKTDYMQISIPAAFSGVLDLKSSSGAVKVVAASTFESVNIRCSSGKVELDGLTVLGSASVSNSSGSLTVKNCVFKTDSAIKNNSGRVEVESTTFTTVGISNNSGTISLTKVTVEEIVVRNDSGRITLDRVEADKIDAKTSSARITGDGVFAIAKFKTSSARIDLSLDCPDITADNSSGSITLNIKGRESEYKQDLKTSSGSIRVDGQKKSERVQNNLTAAKSVYAHTSSGSVNINFN